MTTKEVRKELGKAESTLEMGNKQILIYPNGDKLIFLDGGLDSVNGTPLPRSKAKTNAFQGLNSAPAETEHLLGAPVQRESAINQNLNIAETIQEDAPNNQSIEGEYNYSEYMDHFQESLDEYEEARYEAAYGEAPPSAEERAVELIIGFIAEIIISLIVLKIAFEIVRFPCLWRQLFILSLSIALSSLLVSIVLSGGLFNPVRNGLSFIILLLLIPKLTDVREWPTAISIAITARIVSIVLMWLLFGALMMGIGSFL